MKSNYDVYMCRAESQRSYESTLEELRKYLIDNLVDNHSISCDRFDLFDLSGWEDEKQS